MLADDGVAAVVNRMSCRAVDVKQRVTIARVQLGACELRTRSSGPTVFRISADATSASKVKPAEQGSRRRTNLRNC